MIRNDLRVCVCDQEEEEPARPAAPAPDPSPAQIEAMRRGQEILTEIKLNYCEFWGNLGAILAEKRRFWTSERSPGVEAQSRRRKLLAIHRRVLGDA